HPATPQSSTLSYTTLFRSPPAQIDKLSRLSEGGRAGTARQELERIPELARRLDEPPWNHVIALAEAMDGFPRHVMQHVGGMVISDRKSTRLNSSHVKISYA